MVTVCPLTTRPPKYPGEVAIPRGEAGQTKDALVLCHQVRTIDLRRVSAWEIAGRIQYVADPRVRRQVRAALAHHLALDLPGALDGAT